MYTRLNQAVTRTNRGNKTNTQFPCVSSFVSTSQMAFQTFSYKIQLTPRHSAFLEKLRAGPRIVIKPYALCATQ